MDWPESGARPVTNGASFSGVALSASNGMIISFFRSGADLPVVRFAAGLVGGTPVFPTGGFSAGYVVPRADRLPLFLADSGSIVIAQTGSRASGPFTISGSFDAERR